MVMPRKHHLTLKERIWWQKRIIKHDRWVLATAIRHKPQVVKFHREQLQWTKKELKESLVKFQLSLWPPHHTLWLCIHGGPPYRSSYEAREWDNKNTGRNGHWGGLQMHPDWGYGTSHHASDDSQWTQEWAAEKGYKDSGYSHTWLMGQWAHYECLRYA
jgi:hypothetical protein